MTAATTVPAMLTELRARHGMSQSQFAAHIGIPLATLQGLEAGRRRADDPLLSFLLSAALDTRQEW